MSPRIRNGLLPTQSDARLAQLVRDGNQRAFDVIVERYRRPLRRYCQRMLSETLAEDVVQQTFMHTWSALRDGLEIRDLRPWLYRVAHNAAINTLKRAGYHYEQLEDSQREHESPAVEAERRAEMRSVLANVAALPVNQREALLRTAVNGDSRSDVAAYLGTTDGAVGQLLHRARATLRAAATAIIPLPVLTWGTRSASSGGPGARITELVSGGGGAGVAGLVLKGGAVLVAAGAVAGVPVAVHHLSAPPAAGASATLTASAGPTRGVDSALLGQRMATGAGPAGPLSAGFVFRWARGSQAGSGAGSGSPGPGGGSPPGAEPSASASSADTSSGASSGSDGAISSDGSADAVSAEPPTGVASDATVDASTGTDSSGTTTDPSTTTDNATASADSSASSSGPPSDSNTSSSTDSGSSTTDTSATPSDPSASDPSAAPAPAPAGP